MSLETLFENAKTYLDILRKCSLPEVERWKEEDLERAIHWAKYFKKVHGRLSHRKSIVERLDTKLKEIVREMGLRFGWEKLGLDFVANSLEYLTKVLLENPALPGLLREKILSHVKEQALSSAVKMHLEDMTTSMMMLDTLQTMYSKLIKCFPNEAVCYPGLVAVDALCLQEWLLEDETISNTQLVHKRLQEFAQLDNGLDIILHILLQETSESGSQCAAQQAVLEWVLLKLGALPTNAPSRSDSSSDSAFAHKLWLQTSPKLLAKVSSIHFKFFKEHIKFLVSEVKKLLCIDPETLFKNIQATTEENVSEGVIIVDAEEPTRSKCTAISKESTIETLTAEHFIQLALTGEHVKDVCLSLLKSKVLLHKTEEIPSMSAVLDSPEKNVWYKILTTVVEALQTSSSPSDRFGIKETCMTAC